VISANFVHKVKGVERKEKKRRSKNKIVYSVRKIVVVRAVCSVVRYFIFFRILFIHMIKYKKKEYKEGGSTENVCRRRSCCCCFKGRKVVSERRKILQTLQP
jgi:hypothetical protein